MCVYTKEGLFAVLAFLAFVCEISLHLDEDFFEQSDGWRPRSLRMEAFERLLNSRKLPNLRISFFELAPLKYEYNSIVGIAVAPAYRDPSLR